MSQSPINFTPTFSSTPVASWSDRVADYASDGGIDPKIQFQYDHFVKDTESSSDLWTWEEHVIKTDQRSTRLGGESSTADDNSQDVTVGGTAGRSRRKPANPSRSPPHSDPNFRGVSFTVRAKMKSEDVQLSISFCYSRPKLRRSNLFPKKRRENLEFGSGSDCDDADILIKSDQSHAFIGCLAGKQCASCGTRKTPLWRDAEDGTPLCNACGIRYKKYRVRCGLCWHIPKKESKVYPNCGSCGALLRFCSRKGC